MKKDWLKISLFSLILLFIGFSDASAQFSKNIFGKNRVQHKNFAWKYITTANFEIYFYEEGEEIAQLAAEYAEADFNRTIDLIGFSPYNKIQLFIYNSTTDLYQSNIGVSRQDFIVGGQTTFIRPEAEVAFTGDKASFKKSLKVKIAEALLNEMMYGGNLKDVFQSAYLLILPEWFITGAAEYIAEGWTEEMDNYIRDAFKNRKLKKLNNLNEAEARIMGHSVWNYIAEEYGTTNIASILNLTRIIRNEESSIQNTLGVSFGRFLKEWNIYYTQQHELISQTHIPPSEKNRLFRNKENLYYNRIRLHPNKNLLAYSENKRGRYKVKIKDLQTGKEIKVLIGGYKLISQAFDRNVPLIRWQSESSLAVISTKKGKPILWIYDLKTRKKTSQSLEMFSHVQNFDISQDGKKILMSAENNGQNDLFVGQMGNTNFEQITNDIYDDLDPIFWGERIVFSSNRQNDTLSKQPKIQDEYYQKFNLLVWEENKPFLSRLTNTLSADFSSAVLDDSTLIFKSNQRGIANLFVYQSQLGTATQISNFDNSIQNFDIVGTKMVFALFFKGRNMIFFDKEFNTKQSIFTPKTPRQQTIDLRLLNTLKNKRKEKTEQEQTKNEVVETPKENTANPNNPDEIDTDNYQFDVVKKDKKKLLKNYNPLLLESSSEPLEVSKAQAYESKFGTDFVGFSLFTDPIRSFGPIVEASLTDVLENHKFNLGVFNFTNHANGSYYFEYEFLKHFLDYRIRYDRNRITYFPDQPVFSQNYSFNKIQASVSLPINITSRFTISPFYANTRFEVSSDLDPAIQRIPNRIVEYGGYSAEFVFDNSVVTGLNTFNGIRLRAKYEHYLGLQSGKENFANISLDARFYKKINNSLTLAARLAYGQFVGIAAKNYRLGGMDNWFFKQQDPLPNRDPLYFDSSQPEKDYSDLLFVQYATNLRGFNHNKLFGNNYILANFEARMPLLKYFHKSALTSSFFRNLQFILFSDIGASWTGVSPFNRENALNTVEIEVRPFKAKVSNFKNPFLIGFGWGLRSTVILGFYTKFDMAWGIDDGDVGGAKNYLSLGYDF